MSPGVAIPWPAAPPMPMARSILFTPRLLSESERFGDNLLERSCAGPRQFCAVRWFRSRSARTFWRAPSPPRRPSSPTPGPSPLVHHLILEGAREPTPWRAMQRAARAAVRAPLDQGPGRSRRTLLVRLPRADPLGLGTWSIRAIGCPKVAVFPDTEG